MKLWLLSIGLLVSSSIFAQPLIAADTRCEVDWKNCVYIAEGQAVIQNPKQSESREKGMLDARKSAAVKMMALIQKTSIQGQDPSPILEKYASVRNRITDIINTAKSVDSRQVTLQTKAVAIVTLKIPVYGQDGPGTAIIDAASALDEPIRPTVDLSSSGYTNLIIDTTGLNIKRSMCPRILKSSGEIVYDGRSATIDQIEASGIVSYSKSLDSANKLSRCGSKPLIVKASGSTGIGNWDVIISDSDAATIQTLNNKSHFLDKLNVIIVVD